MSIIRRAFAVGFCASIFLLGGCTTNVQQPADLSARSHDPRGLISGLPAAGEAVCLTAASDHSPTIDIAVRQALRSWIQSCDVVGSGKSAAKTVPLFSCCFGTWRNAAGRSAVHGGA